MSLQQLDNQTVAIELRLATETRILRGTAHYEPSSTVAGQPDDAGPMLRICVQDDAGSFEIHLLESRWDGQLSSGKPYGCTFLLQLWANSLCEK